MKIREFVFEVTTFEPELRQVRFIFGQLAEALQMVKDLPSANAAIYVAALAENVDYGNFYLFLNREGIAHVRLHEHREHFAADPLVQARTGAIEFLDEDARSFKVETALTTSAARGRAALE